METSKTDLQRYREHENAVYKELVERENEERCSKCDALMPREGRMLHFDEAGNFLCSTHADC